MTSDDELHPIARALLSSFASSAYFRSNRMAVAIAERDPAEWVAWALAAVNRFLASSAPHETAQRTLRIVEDALGSLSPKTLEYLDEWSSRSWCSESIDEAAPFAQRAIARLGWATILLICLSTNSEFGFDESGIAVGVGIAANNNGYLREMANQCAAAVDMIYGRTPEGRLLIATSFSQCMKD
ncbi:MAG: hypothetical protein AAFX06_16640 [Planctomycetota bacterium]